MNPWAQEEVHQLDTDTITAFGIRLVSKHANAQEMIEMLDFARAAACANVNMFVVEVFYDSSKRFAKLKFLGSALASAGESIQHEVLTCARRTISLFWWMNRVHRGRPFDDQDPSERL